MKEFYSSSPIIAESELSAAIILAFGKQPHKG